MPPPWERGERIDYTVTYGFLTIASFSFTTRSVTNYLERPLCHVRLRADSDPSIWFVDRQFQIDSLIDERNAVLYYRSYDWDGNNYSPWIYHFDYPRNLLLVYSNYNVTNVPETSDGYRAYPLAEPVRDLMAIMNELRRVFRSGDPPSVISNRVISRMEAYDLPITVSGIEEIKVGKPSRKTRAWRVDGKLPFETLASLSGAFSGWFSTDDRCMPLQARLDVFVGYVYVNYLTHSTNVGPPPSELPCCLPRDTGRWAPR
jgi:hypothetical protein